MMSIDCPVWLIAIALTENKSVHLMTIASELPGNRNVLVMSGGTATRMACGTTIFQKVRVPEAR
jgi:hypothetical protein